MGVLEDTGVKSFSYEIFATFKHYHSNFPRDFDTHNTPQHTFPNTKKFMIVLLFFLPTSLQNCAKNQVDGNECLSSPCPSGHPCMDYTCRYECLCNNGFYGLHCGNGPSCISNPCINGQCNEQFEKGFFCTCEYGWTGELCDSYTDFCASSPCHNQVTCRQVPLVGYRCDCPTQYEGKKCHIDKDYCASQPCLNGGTCVPNYNSAVITYSCKCNGHWSGDNCQIGEDFCNSNPCQHGQCSSELGRRYFCDCFEGFEGQICDTAVACPSVTFCKNSGTF